MFRCRLIPILIVCCGLAHAATTVSAQDLQDLSSCKFSQSQFSQAERTDEISRFYGSTDAAVRFDCDELQFFADYVEIFRKKDLVSARGNVVFVSGGTRIAADRAEFNTRTKTGTFYNAAGTMNIGNRGDRSMFGTQEPDAYFRGVELRKIGPKKYRIINGVFSTCVQPTPRWEISSGSFTINLDDYALLSNAVFRVKGVPLMYMPVFYYPIQEDDRATGFLMPTYGSATLKGQVLSNAFFWAIGRSHDATVYHDWMTKAGHQVGSEYRYVLGPGSQGNAEFRLLSEKTMTGSTGTQPARQSYSISGDGSQMLPGRFRLRANADYFSSVVTQQQYQHDVTRATNRSRRFGSHVTGSIGSYQISAMADRNDYFYTATSLSTYGSLPRITVSRPERPVAGTPIYFGINSEYVTLLRSSTQNDVKTQDQGLTRMDLNPVLRVPFSRWPFLTFTSLASWRGTYWSESLSRPATGQSSQTQVSESLGRQYFDVQTRIVGPVLTRVFNPPEGSTRQKFKHVIEPTVTIQHVTAVDEFDRIVKLESGDFVVGNTTRYSYGITNRLYGKKVAPRELLSVNIGQSYYTQAAAARYDQQYQTSFTDRKDTKFSPLSLTARTSPVERFQAEVRTEWDASTRSLLTVTASGTYSRGTWLDTSAGWSQRRFIQNLPGFNDPDRADQYLNSTTHLRGFRNRIGGTYTFNYDLRNDRFLQQRWIAYYNAQCCGIGFEYQTYNFRGSLVNIGVPQDRRFNISFTLAGVGTFSNLFGAFGGQQGR